MVKQKDTITLNGKVFDVKASFLTRRKHNASQKSQRKEVQKRQPDNDAEVIKVRVKAPRARPGHSAGEVHKRGQHTKTLMRSAVSKPNHAGLYGVTGRLDLAAGGISVEPAFINLKNSHAQKRLEHAKHSSKSRLISRFNLLEPVEEIPPFSKKVERIDVKTSPPPIKPAQSHSAEDTLRPAPHSAIFADALKQANSHKQHPPKRARHRHKIAKKTGLSPRAVNVSASVLVAVVLGGFIFYQNIANINMRRAAAKSGIYASLPSYRPAGFNVSRGIQAQPGQVVVSFKSNSDSRGFTISQTASEWNDQSLLDNYVTSAGQPYEQVTQTDGSVVFMYGDANATWVNDGIWYKLEGDSLLSAGQLLKIADSF